MRKNLLRGKLISWFEASFSHARHTIVPDWFDFTMKLVKVEHQWTYHWCSINIKTFVISLTGDIITDTKHLKVITQCQWMYMCVADVKNQTPHHCIESALKTFSSPSQETKYQNWSLYD